MIIHPDSLSGKEAYKLMISLIIPRPIAWISSMNSDGVVNVAPFSFFTGVRSKPPIVAVSIGQGRSGPKDTARNIEEMGEFVVNLVGEDQAEAMNRTATEYPYGVSEAEEVGLQLIPSDTISVPRIAGSPASLECVLERLIEIGEPPSHLILGEVQAYQLRDELPWDRDDGVDPGQMKVIGRLGQSRYAHLTDLFEMDRIKYQD